MMAALKLPTGTHSRNYAQASTYLIMRRLMKIVLCVLLIQVPLLLSFLGGTLSPAYALDDRQSLTQRITGFSGSQEQEIQSALDNLEQKKRVRFWVYRTDQSYVIDPHNASASESNITGAALTMTTNFTKRENLLMFSTYGLKTNGKCDEITCPITIQSEWEDSEFYSDYRAQLKRNLRDMVNSGKPKQAVVDYLDDLANSSAEELAKESEPTPWWRIILIVGLICAPGVAALIIRERMDVRKCASTLAREQVNNPKKLAHYSVTVLDAYSKKLLKAFAKRIDTYGLAVKQANEDLGAADIPQFRQAQEQAKEALTKASHIYQLFVDKTVEEGKIYRLIRYLIPNYSAANAIDHRSDMLIEIITTLQTANINLAQTTDNIKTMRKEFPNAPELTQKLVQKSINLEGRIPTSATILDTLKKSYSNEILSPVLNNIEAARDELNIAKRVLDLGQTNLKKGTPIALNYIHTADAALQKITKLLDDIDLFETNVNAIIKQLPQQIQSAQNLIKDAETSLNSAKVTNSTTVNQVKVAENQLQTAIDYAQKNINVHPFEAQQKLQEKIDDFHSIVTKVRSETTTLTNGITEIRSLCASARTNISSTEQKYASRITHDRVLATDLAKAKRKLELAEASLKVTNITVPELNKVINTAEKAYILAEQVLYSAQHPR